MCLLIQIFFIFFIKKHFKTCLILANMWDFFYVSDDDDRDDNDEVDKKNWI